MSLFNGLQISWSKHSISTRISNKFSLLFSHNTNPIFVFRLLLFGRKGIEKFWKIDRRIQFLEKVARKSWKKRRREKFCCNSNSQRDDPNSWDEEEEGDRKSKVGKFLETWHRSDAEGGRHLAINAFPLSRWNFISFSSRFVWRNSSLHIEREDKKKKETFRDDTPRIKINVWWKIAFRKTIVNKFANNDRNYVKRSIYHSSGVTSRLFPEYRKLNSRKLVQTRWLFITHGFSWCKIIFTSHMNDMK